MNLDLGRQDTIAAVATATGNGAIAIVRVSGPEANKIRDRVFVPHAQQPWKNAQLRLGDLVWPHKSSADAPKPGERVDEVLLAWFDQGRSYTSEPSLEINVHGGGLNTQRCLQAVLRAGARIAEPGEFTWRAFVAGRIDLSQAEAVQNIVSARTEAALKVAQRALAGAASQALAPLQQDLIALLAEVEAGLDFPEEDFPESLLHELAQRSRTLRQQIEQLLASASSASRLNERPRVVLVGPPNAGKSTLLNALTLSERAITHTQPGTTRDLLEVPLALDDDEVTLVDTAGLRETEDEIEHEALRRTRSSVLQADVRVLVVDGSVPVDDDFKQAQETAGAEAILVINKADLGRHGDWKKLADQHAISLSSRTGDGLSTLRQRLRQAIAPSKNVLDQNWLVTLGRQADELKLSAEALGEVEQAIVQQQGEEVLALELRRALDGLSRVLGREVGDAVLHNIFARFCVGK